MFPFCAFSVLKCCSRLQIFVLTQNSPTTGPETDWRHEIGHRECILYDSTSSHPSIDLFPSLRMSQSVASPLRWSFQTLDFHEDWKLVTLFIGGNDLCQYCHDKVSRCEECRRGEFAAIRQMEGSVQKRQWTVEMGGKQQRPRRCVTPGAQSRLMISLEQNNRALWPALPLIVLLCRTRMRHAFPFNEHILPPQPPCCLPSRPRLALNKHTAHSDRPCSWGGINNRGQPASLHPVSHLVLFMPPFPYFPSTLFHNFTPWHNRVASPSCFEAEHQECCINLRWGPEDCGCDSCCFGKAHACCMESQVLLLAPDAASRKEKKTRVSMTRAARSTSWTSVHFGDAARK